MVNSQVEENNTDVALTLKAVSPERKNINIFDEFYAIAYPDDWSMQTRADFNKAFNRLQILEGQTEFSDTDETEHQDLTVKLCSLIIPECPKPIIKNLTFSQRQAIVMTFFAVVGKDNPLLKARDVLTSLAQSRDSNVSTTPEMSQAG